MKGYEQHCFLQFHAYLRLFISVLSKDDKESSFPQKTALLWVNGILKVCVFWGCELGFESWEEGKNKALVLSEFNLADFFWVFEKCLTAELQIHYEFLEGKHSFKLGKLFQMRLYWFCSCFYLYQFLCCLTLQQCSDPHYLLVGLVSKPFKPFPAELQWQFFIGLLHGFPVEEWRAVADWWYSVGDKLIKPIDPYVSWPQQGLLLPLLPPSISPQPLKDRPHCQLLYLLSNRLL